MYATKIGDKEPGNEVLWQWNRLSTVWNSRGRCVLSSRRTTKVYGASLTFMWVKWQYEIENRRNPKERATTIHTITSGTSSSIFTVVRHKDTRQSHERWMVSLWNVLCLFQRFPLIPIPPDKLSESRLRSLLDMEPLNLDSYVSFSLLDCDQTVQRRCSSTRFGQRQQH